MKLFSKKIKKEPDKDKAANDYIVESVRADVAPENAVIAYILLQSRDNKISLAYKDGITYVCFRNEKISAFLKNWYGILRMHEKKMLDTDVYNMFITSQLSINLPKQEKPIPTKPQRKKKQDTSIIEAPTDEELEIYSDIFND